MATIKTQDYLNTDQAAATIGRISAHSIRRYCLNFEQGRTPAIECTRVGRTILIHRREVARYKKARKKPGRPKSD